VNINVIMTIDKKKISKIFKDNNITYAALFGSYAHGNQTKDSDVDILFDYDQNHSLSLFDIVGIQQKIEVLLNKNVDFIPMKGLKPEIKEEILTSATTIYGQR